MNRLVAALKRLPGIGDKSATRLTFFLLSAPDSLAAELADAIVRLKRETVLCEGCYDLTDRSPCRLCADDQRDDSLICVVEEPGDLQAVERSGQFRGRYHVLGGALSPLEGMGPGHLRIAELERRVRSGGVREVIFATNPNAEGEATANFIAERLRASGVVLSRIACGMPLGGDLEYADHVTVGRSLENRHKLS
ncbi:MAG: recombination mediator RecR [Myxococcota bacterium]|jgi:recombination protein RecR|nr:recombination mediator RecR [Myxococcota bacterium]